MYIQHVRVRVFVFAAEQVSCTMACAGSLCTSSLLAQKQSFAQGSVIKRRATHHHSCAIVACGIVYIIAGIEVLIEYWQLQSQIVFGLTTFVIKDEISFTDLVVY